MNGNNHLGNGSYGRSMSPISDESLGTSDVSASAGINDMLSQENVSLRDRVAELERKLQEQEDEVILLRSSMADVLRRLSHLENQPRSLDGASAASTPLLPKYMSKSSSNLRTHIANSPANDSYSRTRRPISPSPKRVGSISALHVHNGGMNEQPQASVPFRRTAARSNVHNGPLTPSSLNLNSPLGRSASISNIRKADAPNTDLSSGLAQTPLSPTVNRDSSLSSGRYGSLASVSVFGSFRSLAHSFRGGREPVYSQEEGYLKIFLRGKPIDLYAPSNVHNVDVYHTQAAPKEKLKLEWVYGYRGRDCRSNIHCLPTGEIIYFIANIVVLYNAEEQLQRHYLGHTDEVKCIAVHPNRLIIATGQTSKHNGLKNRRSHSRTEMESLLEEGENLPHIRIWDSVSLQTLHVIGVGDFERAISCIAFSKTDGGGLLAAVDESYDHMLSVWDWQKKHRLTETKSSSDPVLACEFHPTEKNSIISCGKGQITFWNFDGVILQRKGRDKAPKYILCLAFTENGNVLSGDSNGNIIMWNSATAKIIKQVSKVHEGGVFSLCAMKSGRLISGGGKDGKLLEWDADLKPLSKFVELPADSGPVRTVACGRGNMIVVGTTHNCILQGTMQFGFSIIMQGHADEVCGLCAHPIQQHFVTCGHDRIVRLWDSQSKRVIWKKEIADPARCASFHPSGQYVAIGTTVGRWIIIDVNTRDVVAANKDGNDVICCIEYSPDGNHIAIGSSDGGLYVHSVSEDGRRYTRIGRCSAHTGSVCHVDWSVDSQYIRSNSSNLELFYWRTVVQKLIPNMDEIRDVEWCTDRCPISFNTAGLWPDNSDGVEVNACDRNSSKALLAAASGSTGEVKLYQYPSVHPKASSCNASGHSNEVRDVRFLQNETRLMTIGGKDCSMAQWEVV